MDPTQQELELQQELQRFTTRFTDRITQATESLGRRSSHRGARDEALRKNLLYVSSAMEIATGPIAEVNLVDMVVFIRLSQAALERHWIPQLYGQAGTDLANAFAQSNQELSLIVERVLSPGQRAQLETIVETWLSDNPTQFRVEGVRLADFSEAAGSAAAERAIQTKGLISSVKTATHAANQALLLSERALFLVHRLPFLWRLQARIAARDMLGDAVAQLTVGSQAPLPKLARQAQQFTRSALMTVGLLGGAGFLVWRLARR